MSNNDPTPGDGADALGEYAKIYMKYQNTIQEYCEKEDWDGLIDYLNSAQRKTGKDHWLTMQLAQTFIEKGDYDNAKQTLQEALRLHDNCIVVPFLTGRVLLDDGDWNDAPVFFKMVIGLDVQKIVDTSTCPCCAEKEQAQTLLADSHLLLSECYAYMGFDDLAREHRDAYQKALDEGAESSFELDSDEDGADDEES